MNLVVKLLLLTGYFVFAKAQNSTEVSVSSQNTTVDLIYLLSIQMDRDIEAAEGKIDQLRSNHGDKINVLNYNLELLETEITRILEEFDLLSSESSYKKMCVEKYRPEVPTKKLVQANINICMTSAKNKSDSLGNPESLYITTLNGRKVSFINGASACLNQYRELYNQTECVKGQILYWKSEFKNSLQTFENTIDSQVCTSNTYVKQSLQCVWTIVSSVFSTINNADFKVNNCIESENSVCRMF